MAILANNAVRTGLQIALAIVIVVLVYVLFRTIQEPQQAYERELAVTEATRARMADVRTAMRTYERRHRRYPTSLDSLVQIVKTDSFFVARRDSIFRLEDGRPFHPDSLPFSARGQRFSLTVVDTSDVAVYLLEDPGSNDYIGTDDPSRAAGMLNAASWE